MNAASIGLVRDASREVIAIDGARPVTSGEYLSRVNGLAAALPQHGAVINLCEDRYRFFLGFGAALARGLTTLLPPNALPATIETIRRTRPAAIVLADAPRAAGAVADVRADEERTGPATNPAIPARLLAAVAFTSGSTGESTAQPKDWNALVAGAAMNVREFFPRQLAGCSVVSTVPAQHMYGLETTVMAALHGPAVLHGGRPFYPADVAAALADTPAPRVLVSTPTHLRALLRSGARLPPVVRILSATAPLDPDLAGELESRFGTELVEIYGCTEVGSMASRRTAVGGAWRFFDGLRPSVRDGATWVDADFMPAPVRLPDALEFDAGGGFRLVGRDSDLVKIAGKRGSLAEVTRRLLALEGVTDGVVLVEPGNVDEARLAALVVSTVHDAESVRAGLRAVLDPVFVPRRVVMVAALPRTPTGKLARESLLAVLNDAAGRLPA